LGNDKCQQEQRQSDRLATLITVFVSECVDDDDQEAERTSEIAVYYFWPGFFVFKRGIGKCLFGSNNLLAGLRPQHVPVTTRPIGTAEACIFQSRK